MVVRSYLILCLSTGSAKVCKIFDAFSLIKKIYLYFLMSNIWRIASYTFFICSTNMSVVFYLWITKHLCAFHQYVLHVKTQKQIIIQEILIMFYSYFYLLSVGTFKNRPYLPKIVCANLTKKGHLTQNITLFEVARFSITKWGHFFS